MCIKKLWRKLETLAASKSFLVIQEHEKFPLIYYFNKKHSFQKIQYKFNLKCFDEPSSETLLKKKIKKSNGSVTGSFFLLFSPGPLLCFEWTK